jgi:hypothetical protein
VVVHVDEAGRHGEAGGVDALAGRRGPQIADPGNVPVADGNIGRHGRGSIAVKHRAARDDQIVRRLRGRTGAGGAERKKQQRGWSAHDVQILARANPRRSIRRQTAAPCLFISLFDFVGINLKV